MHRQKRSFNMMTWLLAALLGTFAVSGTAAAQRVEGDRAAAVGLYAAEIPVRSQSESEREAGFTRALAQVLGKLSGDRNAAQRPGVSQELRRAAQYVEGYDYRQDEGVSSRGSPTFTTTLVVRFRQDDVDAVAGALGLPVWPDPRPKPVMWLAIDDGSGPRLVALLDTLLPVPELDELLSPLLTVIPTYLTPKERRRQSLRFMASAAMVCGVFVVYGLVFALKLTSA